MSDLLAYEWDGEVMRPLARFRKEADKVFVIGERYLMTTVEQRSAASHRHYFSAVRDSWMNLREGTERQFPTPEHLRKYALIRTGYCDSSSLVCPSAAQALKAAAFMRPMDEFSVIDVRDRVVVRYTAKSQSLRAMPKDEFAKSKNDVLDFLSAMIGTTTKELTSATT